jgi:hypothetical protein
LLTAYQDHLIALELRALEAERIAIDAAKTAIEANKLASEAKLDARNARQDLENAARSEHGRIKNLTQLKAERHRKQVDDMVEEFKTWVDCAERLSDECKGEKHMSIMETAETSKICGRKRDVTVSVIDENFEMKVKKLHQRLAESRAYQALDERKKARERMARETPVEGEVAGKEVETNPQGYTR